MGLGWMVWTEPTAIFFAVIALILAAMTVWQIVAPSPERRGAPRLPDPPLHPPVRARVGCVLLSLAGARRSAA